MTLSEWKARISEVVKKHPKAKPLDASGREVPNPVPMDPPVGYKAQPSMFDVMRQLIRDEKVKAALEAEGLESPEEADDFDVDDDVEPHSPYEHNFDHVANPAELQRLRDAIDIRERELRGEIRPSSSSSSDSSSGGGAAAAGGGSSKSAAAPPGASRPAE